MRQVIFEALNNAVENGYRREIMNMNYLELAHDIEQLTGERLHPTVEAVKIIEEWMLANS